MGSVALSRNSHNSLQISWQRILPQSPPRGEVTSRSNLAAPHSHQTQRTPPALRARGRWTLPVLHRRETRNPGPRQRVIHHMLVVYFHGADLLSMFQAEGWRRWRLAMDLSWRRRRLTIVFWSTSRLGASSKRGSFFDSICSDASILQDPLRTHGGRPISPAAILVRL